jgi:hypothetical protein
MDEVHTMSSSKFQSSGKKEGKPTPQPPPQKPPLKTFGVNEGRKKD